MNIKGLGETTPNYPIGALEEYYNITGEDILFDNKPIDTPTKRTAFVFVGLKYGDPCLVKTIKDVAKLSSKEFISVLTGCMEVFTKEFEIEEVEAGEDSDDEKK